ncbi:MAG TPA: glycosyltransferase family 2 protein [Candidatus Saccharimonadales bacterium]|nr:glycosyltransferase family 2 protein [Candidatus Saccharimonadales bacterium]
MAKGSADTAVVVPNWNGEDHLADCLDSLLAQSVPVRVIVVDNGSVDGSLKLLEKYQGLEVILNERNEGFTGGVNPGFQRAIDDNIKYVATLNNDAVADKDWLKHLAAALDKNPRAGIATSKILDGKGKRLDSTGDYLTVWGLPYPRGRGESELDKYDGQTDVFGASGGASLYRVKMLRETGLFDQDFFAYYEDVDLSFRAQLAGWKVRYVPEAVVRHQIGVTSGRLKGFTAYQTLKNQPLVLYKNLPTSMWWRVGWRFTLAHTLFFLRAVGRGHGWAALKGDLRGTVLIFKKHFTRKRIQNNRKVSDDYIWSRLVHDLPPNARNLRRLRAIWWRLRGKRV